MSEPSPAKSLPQHADRLTAFGEWMAEIMRGLVVVTVPVPNNLGLLSPDSAVQGQST